MIDRGAKVLVSGGAGFIGSAVVRLLVGEGYRIVNVDKLTYSGNLQSLREVADSPAYAFHRADICDRATMLEIVRKEQPDAIIHLAAETHVDRSIEGAAEFVQTNVAGTVSLLDAALEYWRGMKDEHRESFRFHHVSTDEVFGDLGRGGDQFREDTPYDPSSPYSASKAAADHFVRAWHRTYELPVILSNCSNNYGPYHFPEKLIPLVTLNAIEGQQLPVYGRGANIRDWLHVEDHARALEMILTRGEIGESYNVGGGAERTNLAVVEAICDVLDQRRPRSQGSHRDLITFVEDRPGHDFRYAIDSSKLERELGWTPQYSFESGIAQTVDWYLDNAWWWRPLREERYAGERLGLIR